MTISVIDLFAGAGGLGLGAVAAGANLRLSVEIETIPCKTLQLNSLHGCNAILQQDVQLLTGQQLRELAGLDKDAPLILAGGPPCQPFSKAGYWTDPGNESRYRRAKSNGILVQKPDPIIKAKPDTRRSLIMEFCRLVSESNASGFLFENVPSILHPRNIEEFNIFRGEIEQCGYKTLLVKANAAEYGVPQMRHRVLLLGVKHMMPSEPRKTHALNLMNLIDGLEKPTCSGDALVPFSGPEYFENDEVVVGKWDRHLREIPPGMNYKALTAWAGHPSPTFVAETKFWHFLLKLDPKKPSWTIAASPGPWTGPFHWDSRRLRTVELAALQGFPADYKFEGNRREKVRQIGNALPPPLAKAAIETLINTINKVHK